MNKSIAFVATAMTELVLAALASWALMPNDERRIVKASFWRGIEQTSMRVAKTAANIAATAEQNYRVSVTR
jgi:hypothetical protein